MSALTRILNNQIYDSTIVASQKIAPGTITGSLFSSNVTVPGDLLISGNLFVLGTSAYTTIASTNTYVNDPLVTLNNGFSGTNNRDCGLIFNRGSSQNQAIVWNEFNKEFRLIGTTETGTTYGNVVASTFANLHVGNIGVDYNLSTNSLAVNSAITASSLNLSGNLLASTVGASFITASTAAVGNLAAVTVGNVGTQFNGTAINLSGNVIAAAGILNALTVNGNESVTGYLNVTGNILGAAGTFSGLTVNGNESITGYLNVTGNVLGAAGTFSGLTVNGNESITGYLNVTGNVLASTVGASFLTASTTVVGNISAVTFGNTGATFTGASLNATGNVLASTVGASFLTASTATIGNIAAVIFGNTGATFTGLTGAFSGNVIGGLAQFAAINSTPIGNALASTGAFTTLTASGIVTFTSATDATSLGSGALQVTGGASIGKNLYVGGNLNIIGNSFVVTSNSGVFYGNAVGSGALYAGVTGYVPQEFTTIQSTGNWNGYIQINNQNINNGSSASTDFVATADNGTASDTFIDMGINSSQYSVAGFALSRANDGYLYVHGNTTTGGGNLLLATMHNNDIIFATNGQDTANEIARLKDGQGLQVKATTPASSSSTGALQVSGGAGIAGNLYVGAGIQGTVIGNVTPAAANFTNVGVSGTITASSLSIGQVNVSGNVLAAAGTFNALTVNGTTTTQVLNSTGNILGTGAVFNSLTVNGNESITGYLNVTGNVLGAAGTFNGLTVNGDELVTGYLNVTGNILGATGTLGILAVNNNLWANASIATTAQGIGAIVVPNGGISVAGAANIAGAITTAGTAQFNNTLTVGGITYYTNTTNATESTGTSGALQIKGGASIAKDLWVGGNIYASNIFGVTHQIITVKDPLVYFDAANTYPYNYDIGFYSNFVGPNPIDNTGNVYQHSGVVRDNADNTWKFFSNVRSEPSGSSITFNADTIYDPVLAGNLRLTYTQTATSTTTGALQVAGGAGIAGNLFAAQINSTGNVIGQLGIFSTLTVNGNTATGNLTVTGSITTSGGDGNISGVNNLTASGYINTSGNISAARINAGNVNSALFTANSAMSITTTGNALSHITMIPNAGNVIIKGGLEVDGNLSTNQFRANGAVVGNLFIGSPINFDSNVSGIQTLTGNLAISSALNTIIQSGNGGNIELQPGMSLTNGVAIGNSSGAFWVAPLSYFTNATDSTSTTSGAVRFTGGIGVAGNVWAGNIYTRNLTLTGALSVSSLNLTGNLLASTVIANFLTASTAAVGNISAVIIGNSGATVTGTIGAFSGNIIGGLAQFAAINATPIGNVTASTGAFTTLSASAGIWANSTTASTNTTTGALVVAGGVGVAGNIFQGGAYFDTSSSNYIFAATPATVNALSSGTFISVGAATGTLVLRNPNITTVQTGTLNLFNANATTINFGGAASQITVGNTGSQFTFNSSTISGPTSVSIFDGSQTVTAFGAAQNLDIGFSSGFANIKSPLVDFTNITNITSSASTALNLFNANILTLNAFGAVTSATIGANNSGNLRIRNDIVFLQNNANVNGTRDATNTTTAALTVAGGAAVKAGMIIGGTLYANAAIDTTRSDYGEGAIVVPNGGLSVSGNIWAGKNLYVGPYAPEAGNVLPGLTIGAIDADPEYTEIAVLNLDNRGSTDLAVYASDFDVDNGWAGIGFTGNAFNDPRYTITKPHDGYVFVSPRATYGGNLVLATDNNGVYNDIVFGLGSFLETSEVMRMHGNISTGGNAWIKYTTSAITPTSGALRVAGGVGVGGNIRTGGGAVFNSSQTYDPFQVKGAATTTLIYADPAYGAVIIGGSNTSPVLGSTLKINSTDSLLLPVGSTGQRPSSTGNVDVQGMLRFNTTLNNIEYYDGISWQTPGVVVSSITDRQFSGNGPYGNVDGVNTTFTIQSNATTAGTLVSINGVIQFPTLAYSVSGTTLTFTEPPAATDVIDVRILVNTTVVDTLASGNGLQQFIASDNAAEIWSGTSYSIKQVQVTPAGDLELLTGQKLTYTQPVVNIVANNTPYVISTWSQAAYTTAKYIVSAKKDSTNVESYEALVTTDGGGNAYITTYGVINNGTTMGTLTANVVSGNVRVYYTTTTGMTNANVKAQGTFVV